MAELATLVLGAVWFILPAYIANMTPVITSPHALRGEGIEKSGLTQKLFFITQKLWGRHRYPIDFHMVFIDKVRVLGDGKSWNGLIAGTLAGGLVGAAQGLLIANPLAGLKLGLVLGFGALFGDLVKSFFKRRIGKVRGASWFPFDQIDFVLGAFLFYWLFYGWVNLSYLAILLIITPALHLTTNWLGFKLGLKNEPW